MTLAHDPLQGADDRLTEQTRSSSLAYRGVFFDVVRDDVSCPDGHQGVREYIDHPGAVMIIALDNDQRVVLERQYRHPLKRSFIEMPAGKLERGEDPLECARRELREETGYEAADWVRLGAFHNAIGYSNEQIAVYLARQLTLTQACTEAGEVLEIFHASCQDLLDWIRRGQLTDVKTMIGTYWLEKFLAGEPGGEDSSAS